MQVNKLTANYELSRSFEHIATYLIIEYVGKVSQLVHIVCIFFLYE